MEEMFYVFEETGSSTCRHFWNTCRTCEYGHVNNMQSTNASSVECNSQCARVYASSMHRW